jgi:hypothetical protein
LFCIYGAPQAHVPRRTLSLPLARPKRQLCTVNLASRNSFSEDGSYAEIVALSLYLSRADV